MVRVFANHIKVLGYNNPLCATINLIKYLLFDYKQLETLTSNKLCTTSVLIEFATTNMSRLNSIGEPWNKSKYIKKVATALIDKNRTHCFISVHSVVVRVFNESVCSNSPWKWIQNKWHWNCQWKNLPLPVTCISHTTNLTSRSSITSCLYACKLLVTMELMWHIEI